MTAVAGDALSHVALPTLLAGYFHGATVTEFTTIARTRFGVLAPRQRKIVPRLEAWAACPIGWNERAADGHSTIALLAKTAPPQAMTSIFSINK